MKSHKKLSAAVLIASADENAGAEPSTKLNKPATEPVAPDPDSKLLTVREAAYVLRCSKSYLDKLRCLGGGPIFIRAGIRKVLYERTSLESWARGRRFDNTSQYPHRVKQETTNNKG